MTYTYNAEDRRVRKETPSDTTKFMYDFEKVLQETDGSDDPQREYTSTTYYPDGQVKATINPLGYRTTTVYDAANRPIRVANPENEITSTTYYAGGQVRNTINPLGYVTTNVYDLADRLTSVTNAEAETTTNRYNADNQLQATINPLGYRTTTVYDKANRPIRVANPENEITSTVYNADSSVRRSINPLGYVTSLAYDKAARKVRSINPENEITSTVYYHDGTVRQNINPLGYVTSLAYDKAARQIRSVNPESEITSTVYNHDGTVRWNINPLGYVTSLAYDKAGRRTRSVSANNEITSTTYYADGTVKANINPLAFRTTFAYDRAARQKRMVDANNYVSTSVYLADGTLQASIDPMLGRTTYNYDKVARQTRITNPRNFSTTTAYYADGTQLRQVDSALAITTFLYDKAARQIALIDALQHRTTSAYYHDGTLQRTLDPVGGMTSFTYDKAARQVQAINALAERTTTSYLDNGLTQAITRPLPGGAQARTTFAYDKADRQIRANDANDNITSTVYDHAGQTVAQISALNYRTTFVYDPAGQRVRLIDANNGIVSFLFDAGGQDVGGIDQLGRRTTFAYDPVGSRIRKINCTGELITYTYDGNRRLTSQIYPTGRHTFTYDPANNRTVFQDETGRTTTTYSSRNEVLSVTNADDKTVNYGYDLPDNRRQGMVDPDGGRFTYSYDDKNRLTRIVNPQAKTTTLVYDAVDREIERRLSNTITTQVYDVGGRQEQILTVNTIRGLVSRFTYVYDNVGNRLRAAQDNGAVISFSYDDSYQLTNEHRTGFQAWNTTYSYDPAGNRLQRRDVNITTYTYDAANQLNLEKTGANRTTYTYTPCGNRAQKDATTSTYYLWDALNRLVSAEPVAGAVTFTYNAENQRVRKEAPAETTKYLYDFEKVLQETDGSNDPQREYTSTLEQYGQLVSQHDELSGDTLYHEFDALGSTDALVDVATDTVTDFYLYHAFGESIHSGPTANNLTFAGEQGYLRDLEIDLYFVRRRYYDYATGQWIGEDPRGYQNVPGTTTPVSNLFQYVANRPTVDTDPSGEVLIAWDQFTAQKYLGWLRDEGWDGNGRGLGLLSVNAFQVTSGRWVFIASDYQEVYEALYHRNLGEGEREILRALLSNARGGANLEVRWYYNDGGPRVDDSGRSWGFYRQATTVDVYEEVVVDHNDRLVDWIARHGTFPTRDEHLEGWGLEYRGRSYTTRDATGVLHVHRVLEPTDLYRRLREAEIGSEQDRWDREQRRIDRLIEQGHAGPSNPFGPVRPMQVREESVWDYVPIVAGVRDFLYHVHDRNPSAAAWAVAFVALDVLPYAGSAFRLARTATSALIRRSVLTLARAGQSLRIGATHATNSTIVSGLRNRGAFQGLRLTGTTRTGLSRASAEWRKLYGPAAMRRHHLVPQEMLQNPAFMQRMQALGYTPDEVRVFLDRQIADIANVAHARVHAEGWNDVWRVWVQRNPNFTLADMRAQVRSMMAEFEVPFSSLGGPKYRR